MASTHLGDWRGPEGIRNRSWFLLILTGTLLVATRSTGLRPRRRFLAMCRHYQSTKPEHIPAESYSQRIVDRTVRWGFFVGVLSTVYGSVIWCFARRVARHRNRRLGDWV